MAERSKAAVLKGEQTEPSGTEPAKTPGNQGGDDSRSAPLTSALPLPDPLPALSSAPPGGGIASHRLELARSLAGAVVASLAAGDPQGARVALDALQGLVEATERVDITAPMMDGAPVVDLAEARRKRGER